MLKYSKFLSALALAASLAPFAANARSDRTQIQNPADQLHLVGTFANGQVATNSGGRAAAANPPAGLFVQDVASQYASTNTAPSEN